MKIIKILFAFAIILCFTSCEKDDGQSTPPQNQDPDPIAFAQNFGNEISRNFLGTVVDINNNPIEGVMITIGNSNILTDNNGVFILNNATVNQRFGYIKAEKAGYIHASRSVVPSIGTNKVRIMMLPETIAGSTSSNTQETISLPNGSKVALEGDYIKADGSAYNGNVNVIMHHLDPVDENMPDQMPGMLYAANSNNEERLLQTFGMLAVELRGDNGDHLNLAEGSTAEITVPLDPSLVATAPSTIPLWYFDETHGYWVEDGEAALVGNSYVGTVSHFSFWNVDIDAELVNFCATFVDNEGNPLANLNITIVSPTLNGSGGLTNENGEVCGQVPLGESLILTAQSLDFCGFNELYETTIGPFSEDQSSDFIISDTTETNLVVETIIGEFLTCDQQPVSDGYVKLSYGDIEVIEMVTEGAFEFTFFRCMESTDFTLQGIDLENSQSSFVVDYNFASPNTDIGTIISCNDYEFNYVYYQVNNNTPISYVEGTFPLIPESFNAFRCRNFSTYFETGLEFNGFSSSTMKLRFANLNGTGIYLGDDGNGDFDASEPFVSIEGNIFTYEGVNLPTAFNYEGTAEILSFGEVGEIVELIFSGTFDVFDRISFGEFELIEENVPISGHMRLIRTN